MTTVIYIRLVSFVVDFKFCLLKMAGDDDYEIPETGAVFTFGRSRFADNQSSHFFIRNDPVVEISCGDEHTALVCKNGRVFLFGHNDYGQLGLGHTKTITKPSCLKYLKPFHSVHVACGKGHTLVSTECGKLFSFGSNSDGQLGLGDLNDRLTPQMVNIDDLGDEHIAAVAAGCLHSAYLTDKGALYLWGSNSDGQCGVDVDAQLLSPTRLSFDLPINSVSCGYYHTAFTSEGFLYTFGEGDNGKLGIPGDTTSRNTPQKLDLDSQFLDVKCGGNHTLALTDGGKVFAFGSNFSGQLGIGTNDAECSVPIQLRFPREDEEIVFISCGESHSAFITKNGELYTCGDARHGKLCNEDDSTNCTLPTLVTLFDNYYCSLVSCGGCHTMVLARVRLDDNDPDIICSQNKVTTLPPLKMKKDVSEFDNAANNSIEEENNKESLRNGDHLEDMIEEAEEEEKAATKEEECDTKSNTESNMNNEEAHSQTDEIYTEIQDIRSDVNDEIHTALDPIDVSPAKTVDLNHKEKEAEVENDVVIKKENRIQKFLNVFRRKKSVTAVLVDEKFTEKDSPSSAVTEKIEEKIGDQQNSKACIIL